MRDNATLILEQDLLKNILLYSEDFGACAQYITVQVRELVGTKTVALLEYVDDGFSLVGICPERRRAAFLSPEMEGVVRQIVSQREAGMIGASDGDLGKELGDRGINGAFVIPLAAGGERLGMLLLLDLEDTHGVGQILSGFQSIAGILSLILRNSRLFRNLETIVAQRTKALQESESRYRRIFDQANEGLAIMNRQGVFEEVNLLFARMHDYSVAELVGMNVTQLNVVGPTTLEDRANDIELMERGHVARFEVQHRRRDGSVFPVGVTSSLILLGGREVFLSFHQDLSEKKKAEEVSFRNQKLESLGILAGGIAHDFNNLLAGIFGFLQLAQITSTEPVVDGYLTKAAAAITRAKGLTQQLLTFAKGGEPVRRVEELSGFLRDTVSFALSGSKVVPQVEIPPDLWLCSFDRNQLAQVIDNLVINAVQAMPNGGQIVVTAHNATIDEATKGPLGPGSYVVVTLADSGIGMTEQQKSQLFTPFFTTKEGGHGLGLATSHSIIQRHGGMIEVESVLGTGTTFRLWLPASQEQAFCRDQPEPQKAEGVPGQGIVVIVDDDADVREILAALVESLGLGAQVFTDGGEALACVAQGGLPLRAMILDLTIPGGKGGSDIIEELRRSFPVLPVFVSSGYYSNPVMAHPEMHGFTASLQKPFDLDELRALLRQHLG